MSRLTAEEQQALPEVRAEEVRLFIAEVIKKATADADVMRNSFDSPLILLDLFT